jgi:hypothetical protein
MTRRDSSIYPLRKISQVRAESSSSRQGRERMEARSWWKWRTGADAILNWSASIGDERLAGMKALGAYSRMSVVVTRRPARMRRERKRGAERREVRVEGAEERVETV